MALIVSLSCQAIEESVLNTGVSDVFVCYEMFDFEKDDEEFDAQMLDAQMLAEDYIFGLDRPQYTIDMPMYKRGAIAKR
jgi:hypothetical protein